MTPEPAATLEEAARVVARAQAELDLVREHEGVALEACQRRVGELEARLEVVGAELKVIKDTLDGLGRRQHQGVPLPAGPPGSLKEILAFLDRARHTPKAQSDVQAIDRFLRQYRETRRSVAEQVDRSVRDYFAAVEAGKVALQRRR